MKNNDTASDQNLFDNNLQPKVEETSSDNNLLDVAAAGNVKPLHEILVLGSHETAGDCLMAEGQLSSAQNEGRQHGIQVPEHGSKGKQGILESNSIETPQGGSLSGVWRDAPTRVVEKNSPEARMILEAGLKVAKMIGDGDPDAYFIEQTLALIHEFFLWDESFDLFIRRKTFSEMDDHVPPGLAKVSELMIDESGELSLLLEWNGGSTMIANRSEASEARF